MEGYILCVYLVMFFIHCVSKKVQLINKAWCKWLIKTKVRFRAAPCWSQSRITRHLTQTITYCYANMVNPSWWATSYINTKDVTAKYVAVKHILCIWNIQWRWSLYVRILCGLLSCDSSPICKKCWSCLCLPLHSWWRFGMPYGLWDFFTS